MDKEKKSYSKDELLEFEGLLSSKLEKAKKDLAHLVDSIKKKASGHDGNFSNYLTMDDGAEVLEKEHLNQLAARTKKYINQVEAALVRIKNGTYGVCIESGKLIQKERLRLVPHTQHSIEAKLNRD